MWIILGLLSAFSDATKNVLAKHITKSFNVFVISWAWVTFSLILLVPIMFIKGIPSLDSTFWTAFTARIILDFISLLLYVEAIRRSELSLTLPMLALSPLFLLVSGFIINREFPSYVGLAGVLLIVFGVYFLNFVRGQSALLDPFKAIYKDKGVFMMFAVALIWGVTGSLHKLAISHSNPYFYTGFGALTLSLLLTPLAYFQDKKQFIESFKAENLKQLVPVGLLDGLTVLTQMMGQSISLTVLVISLKRSSIIFSSIMGWYFFKEDIRTRIIPICFMILGVVLLAFS